MYLVLLRGSTAVHGAAAAWNPGSKNHSLGMLRRGGGAQPMMVLVAELRGNAGEAAPRLPVCTQYDCLSRPWTEVCHVQRPTLTLALEL